MLWLVLGVDLLLLAVATVVVTRERFADARLSREVDAETRRDGVEITIGKTDAALGHRFATLEVLAPFDFIVAGDPEPITVETHTLVMWYGAAGERHRVIPAGTRMRAHYTLVSAPDDGPMRTAPGRSASNVIVLADLEPPTRRPSGTWWFPSAMSLAALAALGLTSTYFGAVAMALAIAFAVVLALDLTVNRRRIASWLFDRDVAPVSLDPVIRTARLVVTVVALALVLSALVTMPFLLPGIKPWTLRHAPAAPLDRVIPALEGRIVTVTGPLISDEQLADPELVLPGNELVLVRAPEVYGRVGRGFSWHGGIVDGIPPQRWAAHRAHVGAYQLALEAETLAKLETELAIPAVRLRRGDQLGALRWDAAGGSYGSSETRVVFRGVPSGIIVTVLAVQRGDRLVSIEESSDGTTGIEIARGEAPGPDVPLETWSSDGSIYACIWVVLFGLLAAFAKVRQTVIAIGAGVALAIIATVTSGGEAGFAIATAIVPVGFCVVTFPFSIPIAVATASLLAIPIAITRATGSAPLAIAASVLAVVAMFFLRRVLGWQRTITYD